MFSTTNEDGGLPTKEKERQTGRTGYRRENIPSSVDGSEKEGISRLDVIDWSSRW